MKTKFPNNSFISRMSHKNLNNAGRYVATIAAILFLAMPQAWGAITYKTQLSATAGTGGSVKLSTSSTVPNTYDGSPIEVNASGAGKTNTYYAWALPSPGYVWKSWTKNNNPKTGASITIETPQNASAQKVICGAPTSNADANCNEKGGVDLWVVDTRYATLIYSISASFAPITLKAPENVTITNLTNPLSTYEEYTGTLIFTASHTVTDADISGVTVKTNSGHGTLTLSKPSVSGNSITVSYTFKGSNTYGGNDNNRNNSFTVTLKTVANQTAACNVSVSFIDPTVTSAGTTEEVRPTSPTAVADGSATFNVKYADDANDFTASFSDATGGTWNPGSLSFKSTEAATGTGVITVPFTFCANGVSDDFSATLTLTPVGSGEAKTITVYAGFGKNYDVEVYNASGVKISEDSKATWAYGLDLANKNAGSTIKLMRNIDLGTITATNNISKAITIDLNGQELRAAVNATSVGVLTITEAVPVTIKDSKTGGKIINEIARNSEIRTIFVNKAGATLTLESGTIAVNNLGQYASAAATVNGVAVAKYASCSARVIHQIAGSTVNINGGRVEAHGTRSVYGIVQASSVATNNAGTTVLNITGGEIYAEAPYGAYGLQGYGKVNFSGGNINVKANTNMVDAIYAADNVNNKYNGLIYGIWISAYANATAASCYYGTLNMTGGNINVTNERVYAVDRKSYGVLIDCANANMGADTAVDGSKCQKAAAKGSIDGGTITVNSGTYYSFGVYMSGSYNSYDNTSHVLTVKNCTIDVKAHTFAYGVFSQGAVNSTNGGCYHGDIELTNCDVTAETTVGAYSYAAFVTSRVATIYKNASADAANYYHGEYGSAGKLTINSGTYKAYSKTTTAYCVSAGNEWAGEARARTVYADETNVALTQHLGGNVEAYPTLIIHGGDFYAETYGKTTARAVSSGGHTIIDGGTFKAVAKTNNAYGLVAVSGTMKATGITVEAEGDATVYGVLVDAGISDYTMFDYAADVELNNCDVTATTRTGTEARGVSVVATTKTQTEATREALSASNKDKYYNLYQIGEKAVAGKVKINGGTYRATAATTTAYGVLLTTTSVSTTGAASASTEGIIKNATFVVKTKGTTSATGIYAGGPTTIDGCNITVQPKTTNGYGVYINDKKTTLSNTTINVTTANTADATKSAAAYGIYNNASISSIGWIFEGELEANEGNVVDVKTTSGTTAYGVYTHAVNKPVTSEVYTTAGTYVAAARTTINGGKYTAHANNTTGYAVGVADPVLGTEVTDIPTCIINGGKFKGTAGAAPFADVSENGEPGYFVLNGGYYVKDENLDKKLGEGMNKVAVKEGTPEYTEGYEWRVTDNMTGEYVCKIKENNSTSYASLEEALQVVNAEPNSQWTIIMIANYTLSKGDYVLPAKTTLLIPYYSTQTAINGSKPTYTSPIENVEQYEAPSPLYKLTFANGVNMSVYGKIEASAVTYLSNQGLLSHGTGVVSGKYGWLYLNEGSHIDLENGSALYAWGYVTGKGEINAKNGSSVYEDFQMGDWRGGSEEIDVYGNKNGLDNKGVFLITHYYYQNIECPITYRAGAQGFAHGGTYMNSLGYEKKVPTKEAVKMIGTSDAMFLMDPATAGEDTWVRKEYDAETDYVNWTMNSGAKLGSVRLKMDLTVIKKIDLSSTDYVLPITSNFNIIANDGEIQISNHVCFIPGSKLTIKKEGTLTIPSGQRVFFYDQADWSSYGGFWFNPYYSPSWKVNPRVATIGDKSKIRMPDAEVLVEGLFNVMGAIYTTAGGANIHSTRENAGKVKFGATLPDPTNEVAPIDASSSNNTTLFQMTAGGPTYTGKALKPAWLKNEDGSYSEPTKENTNVGHVGDTWVYMKSLTKDTYEWTKASENGCFTVRSTGDTKTYVHPSDWVAVGDANDNHAYPSEDGTRMFVNTEAKSTDASCKWWDVNPTPEVIDGVIYYVANNENFDNCGTYYYWDDNTSYWKPKKITVTWQNEDGTKITNGTYGDEYNFNTSPQFFGTNPTWANSPTEKHDWIGWRDAEGNIYDKNTTLPRAKSNVTYTAYFNTTKYQYTITFKNDDNSDLWAGLVDAGTTDAELQALFETKYNEKTGSTVPQKAPTEAEIFTFNGTWSPAITEVNRSATYTAQYAATPRAYTITFLNYDMSVLGTAEVVYDKTPSNATYLAAVAPLTEDPYKPDNSAFSFEFAGWRLQGASENGFAQVKGDQTYIAQYDQTTKKYKVSFVDDDGETLLHWTQLEYGENPSYTWDNPADKQDVEWNYTFSGWTPEFTVVEGTQTYTAVYNKTKRTYRINFMQSDGITTLQSSMVEYNAIPAYTGETPVKDANDDYIYTFSGWTPAIAAVTGDQTYTATYTQSQNMPLDIVDATKTSLTINANGWLASGWPYSINGTSYEKSARAADRTLVFTHTYQEGTSQQITVKNKDGVVVSSHTYTIPLIYDNALGNPTLSGTNDNSIVFVSENTILSVSGNASAAAIYVAPTAELIINNGATLTVGKLVLRTSTSNSAILTNEGILHATKVYYSRITSNNSQYYQFGLPLSCALSDVEMSNTGKFGGSDLTYGSAWLLKSYSEVSRAGNGIRDDGANWTALAAGGTIQGGVGYEMMSNSKYYREYYFPVDISKLGTSVAVSYSSGKAAGAAHAGWNILTSPLMGTYQVPVTDPATDLKIAWLQTDGSYSQELAATIPPAKPFSYQATTDQTELVFGTEAFIYRAPRHQTEMEAQTETEWLQLDLTDEKGQTDQTGVFAHPTRFTDSYEAGIDMAKQSLASTRPILYTTHAYGNMAFAGVSDEALEQGIALTFNSPVAQTLTFSMRNNEWLDRMAYVWLIDNETGERTDLLMDDYRFTAPAGTTTGRFTIAGRFKAPQVATELEPTSDSSLKGRESRKVIINQKMFIEVNGRLYDATGKEVKR